MEYCEDCGCRMTDGICSNCREELYILDVQAGDLDDLTFSEEFARKAAEQREDLRRERQAKRQAKRRDAD